MSAALIERVATVCAAAAAAAPPGSSFAHDVQTIRERLDGPLRVAIAGQVKAGKSTLLNALVAERLAPTDAGECTRIVTWYREGIGYEVRAVTTAGSVVELPHRREGGALQIELGALRVEDVDRLDVAWPSSALQRMTLIDTPGLASLHDETSERARDFLAFEDERPSDADAVVYLLRHLHRRDAEFLDAFMDHALSNASPANTVAVLSRADEVGAGRPDALESAARIAQRYRADPRLKALCLTVVPIATLAAETGLTLHEHEGASLRALAQLPDEQLEPMLLSADLFAAGNGQVSPEERRDLLRRFGMFGVRLAVERFRSGRIANASDLARLLVDVSGLAELRRVLDTHFLPRAQVLKARSALTALRALARSPAASDAAAAARLEDGVERIESVAHEFAELRLVHLALSGAAGLDDNELEETLRATAPGTPAEKLGLPADATADLVARAAVTAVDRWRTAAASPLADPDRRAACEILARSYEGVHAAVTARA